MFPENFVAALKGIVGEAGIRTRPEDLRPFDTDWTKLPGQADLAVLPASTAEVSEVLALCTKHKIAVVPSGGRTGLSGGAVVSQGQVALSLSRMNKIGNLDPLGRTLRVQSGAITQSVHETALEHGYTWPIDLASKGTSTIGGNLATNAGGVRVIRYGMTRKWVTALEAVLMSGEIIELNRDLEKNNSGYDLLQLLIGSEGTLAVITEATLKLTTVPRESVVFFFAVPEISAINDVLISAWK
ncbi:MAG: FAD-binding oxidoreductase, partial [Verrucomicrobiales bacterium]